MLLHYLCRSDIYSRHERWQGAGQAARQAAKQGKQAAGQAVRIRHRDRAARHRGRLGVRVRYLRWHRPAERDGLSGAESSRTGGLRPLALGASGHRAAREAPAAPLLRDHRAGHHRARRGARSVSRAPADRHALAQAGPLARNGPRKSSIARCGSRARHRVSRYPHAGACVCSRAQAAACRMPVGFDETSGDCT